MKSITSRILNFIRETVKFAIYRKMKYRGVIHIILNTLIVVLITGINLNAQDKITLRARVIDSLTKKGIPNAIVHIEYQSYFATTDTNGYFELEANNAKALTLHIHCMGYENIETHWPTDNSPVIFKMTQASTLLDEILVVDKGHPLLNQTSIDAKDIARKDPRDIGEIFSDESGFGVIKRGGYAMDPVFRSFKYEQLNLVFDGGVFVSNACPNRMDPASTHVAPGDINQIELIRGPYSMRYGPAMGAVINIITQKPSYTSQFNVSGNIEGGYEFNGSGISGRAAILMTNKKYDLRINGGLIDFGNYVSGNGNEVPSSFKHYDYSVKLGVAPKKNHRLQVGWRQNFARDVLHAALPMDSDFDNSSIISLDYGIDKPGRKLFSIKAKGFYSHVDHLMSNTNRPNFKKVEAESPVNATTYGGKVELGIKPSPKSVIYTGVDLRAVHKDGYRNRLVKIMNGNPVTPPKLFKDLIWQNSHYYDGGVFAEGTFYLDDNFDVTAGVRMDFVSSNALDTEADFEALYGTDIKTTNTNISMTTTLRYTTEKNGLIMLALGRGQRSANLLERYINHFTIGMDAYEYVGNPNLIPEINNQADIVVKDNIGPFSLSANIFYSYLQHYITAIVDEDIPRKFQPNLEPKFAKRYINIDEAWQYGFNAGIDYKIINPLHFYAGIYYTRAQNVDFNEPLPEITPLTGLFSLSFEKEKYYLKWHGRIVAKQDKVSTSFDETESPGFQVWDFTAGYTPVKLLTLTFSVRNIFNANYYEHLSRPYKNLSEENMFYEPGRQLKLGLTMSF